MNAWAAPTPYARQPIDVQTLALERKRGILVNRDRAATLEAASIVRYRLEAGEVDWEIAPGRKVRGYGFNGQVPGPILEAKQGVPLQIEFTNRLPEPTVIHWHGLRIPAAMDGTEVVQRPVQPGETFTYRFTPPDAGRE
jgi:FtsP/CotA-like multicopper oxidase with cupredoxin domain